MRHYTFTDQLYHSDVKNATVAVTADTQVMELAPASKTLFLRNDGPNDAFLAFDADQVTVNDFKLRPTDGLVKMKVQCKKIALVCAPTETATVRVSSNF